MIKKKRKNLISDCNHRNTFPMCVSECVCVSESKDEEEALRARVYGRRWSVWHLECNPTSSDLPVWFLVLHLRAVLHLDVKHDPLVLFHMDTPDAVLPFVVGLRPIRRQHHTGRVCDLPAAHSCNAQKHLWLTLRNKCLHFHRFQDAENVNCNYIN